MTDETSTQEYLDEVNTRCIEVCLKESGKPKVIEKGDIIVADGNNNLFTNINEEPVLINESNNRALIKVKPIMPVVEPVGNLNIIEKGPAGIMVCSFMTAKEKVHHLMFRDERDSREILMLQLMSSIVDSLNDIKRVLERKRY